MSIHCPELIKKYYASDLRWGCLGLGTRLSTSGYLETGTKLISELYPFRAAVPNRLHGPWFCREHANGDMSARTIQR